jgi:hypothetical protein
MQGRPWAIILPVAVSVLFAVVLSRAGYEEPADDLRLDTGATTSSSPPGTAVELVPTTVPELVVPPEGPPVAVSGATASAPRRRAATKTAPVRRAPAAPTATTTSTLTMPRPTSSTTPGAPPDQQNPCDNEMYRQFFPQGCP